MSDHPVALAPEVVRRLLHAVSPPPTRPLALRGRTGSGKTTLLREVALRSARETVWYTAFDLVDELTRSIRDGRYESYREALVQDDRPLYVEHLEDLRGKPRTREELGLLLGRAATRRPILLTLTRTKDDAEILAWLRARAEVFSLD